MKRSAGLLVLMLLLQTGVTHADRIIGEVPDTLPGKGAGALSGFMAGAAVGGPFGAAFGAGMGWIAGGETQKAASLGGRAYRVSLDEGGETVVRSPGGNWSPGDRVRVVGGRLVAEGDSRVTAGPVGMLMY